MSYFICKSQCWLSLLTASHVHEVDRTTAGSMAAEGIFPFSFYGCPDCSGVSDFFEEIQCSIFCLDGSLSPIKLGLANEFGCRARLPV